MKFLFDEAIYNPLYNLLIGIYNFFPFHDFGIAIIIVTIIIKFLLIPLSKKQIESQKKMQELQPKIKELQTKYKDNKEKQSRALMELYKENKTNPFSGCLPTIIQIIFFMTFYRILFNVGNMNFNTDINTLYDFMHNPEQINNTFLGFINIAERVNFNGVSMASLFISPLVTLSNFFAIIYNNQAHSILAILAALSQYFQMKMLMAKQALAPKKDGEEPDFAQIMSKQMLFLGPVMTFLLGISFPAGLALYWLTSTVFMIIQQQYLQKKQLITEKKG